MLRLWPVLLCGCLGNYDPPNGGGNADLSGGGGSTDMATGGGNVDPHIQHCLAGLNMYRSQAGVQPYSLSDALNAFALEGSKELAAGGPAHGHFSDAGNAGTLFSSGFCNGAAENQAPGWSIAPDEDSTIDAVLSSMMSEGPGGGHHDNIVSPGFAIVGVGLYITGNQLWFTNDFSPPCP